MNKKLSIVIIIGLLIVGIVLFFKFGDLGQTLLSSWSQDNSFLLPLIFVASLIDSVNPCAFSILLLTVAFLASLGHLRSKILAIGATYILGIFAVYMLIGLGIIQVLSFLNIPHFMAKIGAVILITTGVINLINDFFPNFPIKLRIPQMTHEKIAKLVAKASVPTAFVLGVLVGLFEFPCTGGPYLLVLGLLHDRETYLSGLGYLLFYNLIFVLPLVIILLIGSERRLLAKVEDWKKRETKGLRFWLGIMVIVVGVIIFIL